jgi:hypothetical protein
MICRPIVRLLTRIRRDCDRIIRWLGGPLCRDVIVSVGPVTPAGRIPLNFVLSCPCCGEIGVVPVSMTAVQASGLSDDIATAVESVHVRSMVRATGRSAN